MSKEAKQSSDVSGRVKEINVHDSQSGTLKKIKASNQDALSRAVPATHNLKENTQKRIVPRSK